MDGKTAETLRDFLARYRGYHAVACVIVLAITLSLGLWPFHVRANEVQWLDSGGIAFGEDGTVFSAADFTLPRVPPTGGRTIEIWVRPGYPNCTCTIVAFYEPQGLVRFTLRQYYHTAALDAQTRNPDGTIKRESVEMGNVLQEDELVMISLSSGERGAAVYINGKQQWQDPNRRLFDEPFHGALVLGDAPGQPDNWVGEVQGFAIFDSVLPASRIEEHFRSWSQDRQLPLQDADRAAAVYRMDEKAGGDIRNRIGPGLDLKIPDYYTVAGKRFMEPFWEEFEFTRNFAESLVKNVVGFVPYGVCFFSFLLAGGVRRPVLWTILLGTAGSVTIEVFQVFLPMRESGTTDIFTNTFGTWLGVICYRRFAFPLFARLDGTRAS